MTKLGSRLLRHLSFANLLACLALFVALGGVGYAAATINGNAIKQQTIAAGKLKKGTLTSTQVKANALTGSVIDESTLTIVPSAQTATTAQTANSATTAQSAETAEEAETLDGFTSEELHVSCQAETSLYGGMCWDDDLRPLKLWATAAIECGDVIDLPSGKEHVLTRNETTTASSDSSPATFGFRCVFYRAN